MPFEKSLPQLKIKGKVARVPIIQGGMGIGVSLSPLASAVAGEIADPREVLTFEL